MPRFRTAAAALIALLPLVSCNRAGDGAAGGPAGGPGIVFASTGFDEALARARAEKRILLVDVYTDWCGWCKKLDAEGCAFSIRACACSHVSLGPVGPVFGLAVVIV